MSGNSVKWLILVTLNLILGDPLCNLRLLLLRICPRESEGVTKRNQFYYPMVSDAAVLGRMSSGFVRMQYVKYGLQGVHRL
jgi:hypothetical protein